MRKLKLVMGAMWGLFAVASGMACISGRSLFMLIMAVSCGVFSVVNFIEYRLLGDEID